MARFQPLTVTDVRKTIRDAVVVTFDAKMDFIPGQYLTFRRDFDGTEIRRSYSICAGLNDGHIQVGIKKVSGGAFSTWANDNLKPGMVLEAMAPEGRFHTKLSPDQEKTYLGFAGGSGITPVLSILKTVLEDEPLSRFTLVYANRAVNTIMFRDELEDLKNLYMGRLNVIHVLESDSQEIDLFTGLVTQEKCDELFARWIDIGSVDTAFICGPEPMMLGIVAALKSHGMPEDQIKFELFKSDQPGRLIRPVAVDQSLASGIDLSVTIDGATRKVPMHADQTVLEAALAADLDAPFSCRAGVCSTCRCRVLDGEVEMATNHALEDHEVADGYILSCQSFPISDKLVVDYDSGHT